MIRVCEKLDLPMVEITEKGDNFNYTLEDLKNLSKGFYEKTTNYREGLVFRFQKGWFVSTKEKYSFKIINDDYLVKKHRNENKIN